MTREQVNFRKRDELLGTLRSLLAARFCQPAGALVTASVLPEGNRLVAGRIDFRDEATEAAVPIDYPELVLLQEWWPWEGLLESLDKLFSGNGSICGTRVRTEVQRGHGRRSVGRSYDWDRTGWSFEIRPESDEKNDPRLEGYPLVAPGRRPFPSARAAVSHWVHGRTSVDGQVSAMPEWTLFLPEIRGRIETADWEPGKLAVHVSGAVPREELELQVLFGAAGEHGHELIKAPEERCRQAVPEDTTAIQLYLVHSEGDLLDEVLLRGPRTTYDAEHPLSVHQVAERDLQRGEGESVEYKTWIEPRNDKMYDLYRTVVAFLNTRGGRLYLGVEDNGELSGWKGLDGISRGRPEEALQEIALLVDKSLKENIKPYADVAVHGIEVRGKPLVVVVVEQGYDGPYATEKNDVFVRKGASSRKADPRTELAELYRGRIEWRGV